jgi:hypothetical protein
MHVRVKDYERSCIPFWLDVGVLVDINMSARLRFSQLRFSRRPRALVFTFCDHHRPSSRTATGEPSSEDILCARGVAILRIEGGTAHVRDHAISCAWRGRERSGSCQPHQVEWIGALCLPRGFFIVRHGWSLGAGWTSTWIRSNSYRVANDWTRTHSRRLRHTRSADRWRAPPPRPRRRRWRRAPC